MGLLDFFRRPSVPSPLVQEREQNELLALRSQNRMLSSLVQDNLPWVNGWHDFPYRNHTPTDAPLDQLLGYDDVLGDLQKLGQVRDFARNLCLRNKFAVGIISCLENFLVGAGCQYTAGTKDGARDELVGAVQDVLDEFTERTAWAQWEQEIVRRRARDGEVFLRLFADTPAAGYLDVRVIEPEWVQQPDGTQRQCCDADYGELHWKHGIACHPKDKQTPVGYWVEYPDEPGEFVPAAEIIHLKANVDRNVPRGVSDFFPVSDDLLGISKLLSNMRIGEATRAAISGFWEYESATAAAVSAHITAIKDQVQPRGLGQQPITGKTDSYQHIQGGTFVHVPKGKLFKPPPASPATSSQVQVEDACLRGVATRWQMPEFIFAQAANNNYACHDSETELLTKRGWLRWDEIKYGDEAGTMNPENDEFEWQAIQAIHVYDHAGEMVRLKGEHNLDVLVTPNHRMYSARTRSEMREGKQMRVGIHPFGFVRADELKPGSALPFACRPKSQGIPIEMFELPPARHARLYRDDFAHPQMRSIPMGGFLRYLGWWVSEGWTYSKGAPYTVGVSQSTKQAMECEDIRRSAVALKAAGMNVREHVQANGMTAWQATDKSLWTWLRHYCGTGSYSKRLPEFVNDLPVGQQRELLEAMLLGDGCERKSGSFGYYTVSRKLADQVQSLAIQCGCIAHVANPMANGVIPIYIKPPAYDARVSARHISRVPYTGKVWCVTVPNGLTVTRRGGKAIVSGNSILIAGAPFVREIKKHQGILNPVQLKVMWKAVEVAAQAGRMGTLTWREVEALTEIQCEAPAPELSNELEQAQVDSIDLQAGVLSKQTRRMRRGLDSEQEQENLKLEPVQVQGMGLPGFGLPLPEEPEASPAATPEPEQQSGAIAGNDLRTTVGGLNAVASLQSQYYAGKLPREAAIANVKVLLGFTDQEAASLFPEIAPVKLTPDEAPPPTDAPAVESVQEGEDDTAGVKHAKNVADAALKAGKIKQGKCERCGATDAEMHHTDYRKPLEVTWLCRRCHDKAHGKEVKESLPFRLDALADAFLRAKQRASQ